VRATAWHGGAGERGSYGIKFTEADRDRYFDRSWRDVVLELDGAGTTKARLTPSFWRVCSEVRSRAIGDWLIRARVAPWPTGSPPGLVVTPEGGNRFAVRLLQRHMLI